MKKSNVNLKLVTYPYVRIAVPEDKLEDIGKNLRKLYIYIDENTKYMGSRYQFGNAYRIIRQEAQRMIHRNDIKIFKREVSSLIQCKFSITKKSYIRIPYKMYYIFMAIFKIVDEIKVEHPLGSNLEKFVGQIRRRCFYEEQSSLFQSVFQGTDKTQNENMRALYNDMFAGNSVLSQKF